MPPPSGMSRIVLAVLLVLTALQVSAAAGGGWLSWFQGRLDVVQQQVQQRQAEYLQKQQRLATAAADSTAAPAQRRLMQEAEAAADTGSYGYGSYGYGYGYGAGTSSSSSRRRLQETPGLAPTLVYDANHIEQVRQIGEAHADGVELGTDAPVLATTVHERPVEIRAARKLLLTASDINVAALEQVVLPLAPITLEPEDVLSSHSRALLQDADLAGGYGGYGYGYGYGGYGTDAASGRSLLESGDVDDVQLYNIWLQKHLQQQKH